MLAVLMLVQMPVEAELFWGSAAGWPRSKGEELEEQSSLRAMIGAHRRAVLLCVLLLLGIALWLRLFVYVERVGARVSYDALIRASLDGLLSTILVSAVLGTFFWWVSAPANGQRTPVIGELFPDLISNRLERAALVADEWDYVGHTARYVRSRILPILGTRSKRGGRPVKVRFVIIDLLNVALCREYAAYRGKSRSSPFSPRVWDTVGIQTELLTTIVCLIQAKARFPDLEIRLGLAPSFSLWRFDRSNDMVVVTQEDPQQPAYRYEKDSRFFNYHLQECELAWQLARGIVVTAPQAENLSEAQVGDIVQRLLGRAAARQLAPFLPAAYEAAKAPASPYA